MTICIDPQDDNTLLYAVSTEDALYPFHYYDYIGIHPYTSDHFLYRNPELTFKSWVIIL